MPGDSQPVAMIGMGCRLPGGVSSPAEFWRLLCDGIDAVGEIDAQRWQHYAALGPEFGAVLDRTTRTGGSLTDIAGFDAEFFGLTPREAELMDPQHRLLLEVAWEALEDAGIPPDTLRGSDTGVYAGIGSDDYGRLQLEDLPRVEAWTGIGAAQCGAANRVSYALDLRGPSLSVDTACSSSLVALHLACAALRRGETAVALVGGVNLMVSPGLTVTLDQAGALAADGRSKAFSAQADGYGRGEGCGVIVLKLLSDALRDNDIVHAVVRGSAVAQDGRTNGIMAPSQEAQEHLLRQACQAAGVAPGSIDYVEAHGTGTPVGDVIEAGALSTVYGRTRPGDRPCLIGSAKTNIGHLEAGAGVVGLIKAALALSHREIPATLHCATPNPAIPWDSAGLRVVTRPTAWPDGTGPRRAGVSGFGYGGTIAHVVLDEAPLPVSASAETLDVPRIFPVSAVSEAGLRDQAAALAQWLAEPVALASVGHTLAHRRTHLPHRAVVLADDNSGLAAGLRQIAAGDQAPAARTGTVSAGPQAGTVWVFSGHGSQWAGMGRELLANETFRAMIDRIDPIYREELDFPVTEAFANGELGSVDRIQSMICAMQLGIAAVLRERTGPPAAIIGHSVGEIAAAVTAGVLTAEDGARLVCRRSRLLRRVTGKGAMAMVSLSFDDVEARLADVDGVCAAVDASTTTTVISGDPAAVESIVDELRAEGVLVRKVDSDVAFHSPQMWPLLGELAAVAGVSPRAPQVTLYSTASLDPRADEPRDGAYWAANLGNPVRFTAAVRAAADDGYRIFVEIAPHPVVTHSIGDTLSEVPALHVQGTLRRNENEQAALLGAVGELFTHGGHVDWNVLQPTGGLLPLPTRLWQHHTHWRVPAHRPAAIGHDPRTHTLLGSRTEIGTAAMDVWQTTLDATSRPCPGEHLVRGVEIIPAAVVLATFLAAAQTTALSEVTLRTPLTVSPHDVQVVRQGDELRLVSRTDGRAWQTNATAVAGGGKPLRDLDSTADRPADPGDVQAFQRSVGVPEMAFDWRVIRLARGDRAVHAKVTVPGKAGWAPVMDAALSIAPLVFGGKPVLRMISAMAGVELCGAPPTAWSVIAESEPVGDAQRTATAHIAIIDDATGTPVAHLTGVAYTELDNEPVAATDPAQLVHKIEWRPFTSATTAHEPPRRAVLVGGDARMRAALRPVLRAAGIDWTPIPTPEMLGGFRPEQRPTDTVIVLPPPGGEDLAAIAERSAWLLARTAQLVAQWSKPPSLWCLTQGVREGSSRDAVAQAPLWGLGRVIAGEHPELWGGVVDLDPADLDVTALPELLVKGHGEDVISVRAGEISVARLVTVPGPATAGPLECVPDGTYLVTGGLGTLGRQVAHWLVSRGARRLVLATRSPLPPRAQWDDSTRGAAVRALEAAGATVRVVELDVADAAQAAAALTPDSLGMPPIRGVVHLAGILDDRMAGDLDEASLRAVMRPKSRGALVLHEMFPPGTVDFFVLFSSAGLLLGMPGQSSYASANGFLDGLARHRAALGDTGALSLGFTSWRGLGMAVNAVVTEELRARGTTEITSDDAFESWDFAARHGLPYAAVLRPGELQDAATAQPLIRELAFTTPAADTAEAGTSADHSPEGLLAEVTMQVATEMRVPVQQVDIRRSLADLGLDSVMFLIIRRRLAQRYRLDLPATLLWTRPTITAIADYLGSVLPAADAG
jgi:6-methylsalicylic acid synthase